MKWPFVGQLAIAFHANEAVTNGHFSPHFPENALDQVLHRVWSGTDQGRFLAQYRSGVAENEERT